MISKVISRIFGFLAACGLVGSAVPSVQPGTIAKSVQPPTKNPLESILQACSDGLPPHGCSPVPLPPHRLFQRHARS